jgi:precorrin-3B C17-methyltransferase
MFTIVIVGNSQTAVYGGKLLTPRGYAGKYDLGEREEPDTDASA